MNASNPDSTKRLDPSAEIDNGGVPRREGRHLDQLLGAGALHVHRHQRDNRDHQHQGQRRRLRVLPLLQPCDLLLTDPPYGISSPSASLPSLR